MKASELLQEKTKGPVPEWAIKEQVAFRSFVQEFGFQMSALKPQKGQKGTSDMIIGGIVKDKSADHLLPIEYRLKALKKHLAVYLLNLARQDRYVKLFTNSWWSHNPHYIFPEDTLRAAEQAVENVVAFKARDWQGYGPKELEICFSLSEPKL